MRVALLSCNLGGFDPSSKWLKQSGVITCRITDKQFPPRHRSMTPRLQARIVKCFGWEFVEADFIIWLDSSMAPCTTTSAWDLYELGANYDLSVFLHPERKTIKEEADYIKRRLKNKDPYIVLRYENELIDQQLKAIPNTYHCAPLLASTCFIYRNSPQVRAALKEWWYHISRFHSVDQLSFPYIVFSSGLNVQVFTNHLYDTPYIKKIRPTGWKTTSDT